jgi:hypothetical protein
MGGKREEANPYLPPGSGSLLVQQSDWRFAPLGSVMRRDLLHQMLIGFPTFMLLWPVRPDWIAAPVWQVALLVFLAQTAISWFANTTWLAPRRWAFRWDDDVIQGPIAFRSGGGPGHQMTLARDQSITITRRWLPHPATELKGADGTVVTLIHRYAPLAARQALLAELAVANRRYAEPKHG